MILHPAVVAEANEASAMLRAASWERMFGELLVRAGKQEARAGTEIARRIAAERRGGK